MVDPTSELVGRVLVEKRFELYSRAAAVLLELEEVSSGVGPDDGRRALLLLTDLRKVLRGGLALLTAEVHRELVHLEEMSDAWSDDASRAGAPDPQELRDRLALLHVTLARMLGSAALEPLETVVGLPPRLLQRLEAGRRDQDALARARGLEEECLRHEHEARDLVGRQQYARAARSLRKGLEIDPERAVFHNDLGVILSLMGRQDEAVDSYRRAVALNQRRPERRTDEWATTYYNLGTALRKSAAEALQRGERELARERLVEARASLTEFARLVSGPKAEDARRAVDQVTGQILSIEAPAETT